MTPRAFCTKCGGALRPSATFCTRCGAPVVVTEPLPQAAGAEGAPVAGPQQSWAAQATSVAGQVQGMYATANTAAGLAMSLPWQTIAGNEPFDPKGFALAVAPAAQQAVRASLRRPAAALAITSALDLAVAYISGQPAAMQMALVRFGVAALTALLGMLAGSRGGPLAKLTGASSVVTALVQLVSFARTAFAGLSAPATLLPLLPSFVSQVSALVMAVKTAIAGFRS